MVLTTQYTTDTVLTVYLCTVTTNDVCDVSDTIGIKSVGRDTTRNWIDHHHSQMHQYRQHLPSAAAADCLTAASNVLMKNKNGRVLLIVPELTNRN